MSGKKKRTYRGVFIIESTDDDDEEHDRKEGKALTAMLELAKRPVLYRYIRTKKELDKMGNSRRRPTGICTWPATGSQTESG